MQGKLLVAHPLLNDSFFNRSVIYLTDYSKDGAIGFSLNFKTEFNLSDIKTNIKNGHFPIYEGGPVAKNELFFLHTLGSQISNASKINNYFFIGGDFNELTFLIEKGKVGEIYNVAGGFEQQNIETVKQIISEWSGIVNWEDFADIRHYIDFSLNRPGQDVRYALDDSKIKALGWEPKKLFNQEISSIVNYYKNKFIW